MILLKDGKVMGCGKQTYGELGLGPPHEDLQHLDKGILEFVPIYSLSNVRAQQIFAGGFHSYIVIDKQNPLAGKLDHIIKEYQIVYTDTAMSHRFLRFTLPFGASLVPLNTLLKDWSTDPLASSSIQIDCDIKDPSGNLLSAGHTKSRQFVTVRLVCDLIGHVGLEQDSSDEDAIRQSERPEV